MAGLIASAEEKQAPGGQEAPLPEQEGMPEELPTEEAAEGPTDEPEAGGITPKAVRAKMDLPPELKDAYERVVLAGMKVLFSKETHESALGVMQGEGPVEQRLAEGITVLMGTLFERSNKTMPPQVMIPAGIELLAAAGDYLKQAGDEQITDEQISESMALFVQDILVESGAGDPAKIAAMLQAPGLDAAPGKGLVSGAPPAEEPEPGAPPAEEEEPV